MPRPSPRTQHRTGIIDPETGEEIVIGGYRTQQLDFVGGKPPQVGTPYQGVEPSKRATASFVGFRGFTQNVIPRGTFGSPTLNPSVTIASNTGYVAPPLIATGKGEDCGWFGEKCWEKDNGEDCGWFGEKCWGKDNGEDCGWFGEKCWFKNIDLGWIKWVLVLIGIGVLLWLLRPLFGIAKNITEK